MTRSEQTSQKWWNLAAYVCASVALGLIVLIGAWGAAQDLHLVRTTLLQAEVASLHAEATQRVEQLEHALQQHVETPELDRLPTGAPWLRDFWQHALSLQKQQLYAAIVDSAGIVVMHTNPKLEGQRLERRWYERVVPELSGDVVEVQSGVLAEGKPAFDIRIPILHNGQKIGDYHEGLDATWFNKLYADREREVVRRWMLAIGGITLIALGACIALYWLATRSVGLGQAVRLAHAHRMREAAHIAAGLAHEIRNPLHAIRLNLHAIRRVLNGNAELSIEEINSITQDTNRDIDRVEMLMRELLSFAAPEEAHAEQLDLREGVQSTLNFVTQEMRSKQIEICSQLPDQPVMVSIDPDRLRQILLNLLTSARESVPEGGQIKVELEKRAGQAEISVVDNGPAISETDCQRIFQPFQYARPAGAGFSLALVERFVDEAGGTVQCESNSTGARFRIQFPELGFRKKVQWS